ncbi:MAG: PQQ-binding-like beta-propeller repeat protein [Polyangiales bacterium]
MSTLPFVVVGGASCVSSNDTPSPAPTTSTSTTATTSTSASASNSALAHLQSGSPWPKFRRDLPQTGRTALVPTAASVSGEKPWFVQTGKGIFSSPVVGADGSIYIGSADRTFYSFTHAGAQRWQLLTGEIIDSSALLDDEGKVYFGSGDGKLRALDAATGDVKWTFQADDPSVRSAFINWFEGNVAIGPSGNLYVPNDNWFIYSINREVGSVVWKFPMPDQTWSLPAIDPATETLYLGNNNTTALLGRNVYQLNSDGTSGWQAITKGTNAASFSLGNGLAYLASFDGFVHAYDQNSGDETWSFGTRDHVYASPAIAADGSLVVPGTDGTLYDLDGLTGALKWSFEIGEPVRSSPAIGGDGVIYFGGGDGRLYAVNSDGSLRWSMLLISADRNDLNSSPALGATAIYLGGESGQFFSVPYDYCLSTDGLADVRCTTPRPTLPDGAALLFTTAYGSLEGTPPTTIDANQPLSFALSVTASGRRQIATIDASSVKVTVTPTNAAGGPTVDVAGDGKFLNLTPNTPYVPGTDGNVTITLTGSWLESFTRDGLRLTGGTKGGDFTTTFTTKVVTASTTPPTLTEPAFDTTGTIAAAGSRWELKRLALPLPTILPSYNQIGFDSLHYVLSRVEPGVVWMEGATLATDSNTTVIDPTTRSTLALSETISNGLLTLQNQAGLSFEVTNITIPMRTFYIGAQLGADGNSVAGARLTGSTICAGVPIYGTFLELLGLCNPTTDLLAVAGASLFVTFAGHAPPSVSDIGTVTISASGTTVTATLTGTTLKSADHSASILIVGPDGQPLPVPYGINTTKNADASGMLSTVVLSLGTQTIATGSHAYLMVDALPLVKKSL